MSDLTLRTVLTFELDDDTKWFADKTLVGSLVNALLATDLASAITHAGVMGKEKPAKGADAVRKAMNTGKAGVVTALDGPDGDKAGLTIWYDFDTDRFKVTIMVTGPALAARRKTIVPSIENLGVELTKAMRPLGGLAIGFCHPMRDGGFEYPRVRPPITHKRLEVSSILDFVDLTFHRSEHDRARDEMVKVGTAKVPKQCKRTERDGLVTLRWIDSIEDERALAIAAGRHEQWLAGVAEVERSGVFNEHGDVVVDLSERKKVAPFTLFDPDEGIGYKAIIVDPKGEPDDEVWAEMVKALKSKKAGLKGIRLIAPLRNLALKLGDRARKAGFDAVLYPDDQNRFWNPQPEGWWIDDVDSDRNA